VILIPIEINTMNNLLQIFIYIILALIHLNSISCAINYPYVTCGSVLKLFNPNYNTRLHSHDVKYGSGSGQQSVTATEQEEDNNSYWTVRGRVEKMCQRGEPIECGSVIRLQHVQTKRNLHSHHFSSPLSGNQEVSAFGEDGNGDTGDNWTVVCNGDYWERVTDIRLKHVDTEMWLSLSGNTFGRPINGQMEVIGIPYPDSTSYWKCKEGVFIRPGDKIGSNNSEHDEL